jgi:uncharacterized protein (DUF305 family)
MRIKVALAAAALVATGVLAGCTGTPAEDTAPIIQPKGPGEAAQTLSPDDIGTNWQTPPNEADLAYVVGMIEHHRQALEMSSLAPERAANETVRGLASRIADAQGPEIKAMEQWQRQYATQAPAHGHSGEMPHVDHTSMPGMATPEQLAELKAARGADFDRLFLRLMIAHHEGALKMVTDHAAKGVDVRVGEMADDVAATQAAEIAKMQAVQIP